LWEGKKVVQRQR